jgi:hypothetical protein
MKLRKNTAQPCDKRTENRWERKKNKEKSVGEKKELRISHNHATKELRIGGREKKLRKIPHSHETEKKSLRAILLAWHNLANPMSALLAGKLQSMIYPIHEQDHRTIPAAAVWACLSNPSNHTSGCGMACLSNPHVVLDEARVTVVVCCSEMSHGGGGGGWISPLEISGSGISWGRGVLPTELMV